MLRVKRPPPPLLRPQRRRISGVVRGAALLLAGLVIGFVLGVGLGTPERVDAPPPAMPEPAGTAAQSPQREDLRAELEVLRRAAAEEEARLQDLARARVKAEAELAALEQQVEAASARRTEATPRPPPPAPTSAPAAAPAPRPAAPPGAGTATAPVPAPAPATTRVVVHYRAGSEASRETARATADSLTAAGFEVAGLRPVPGAPAQRVVRYFHSEDAAAAARLAGRLGRGWAIQDFRSYEPSPAPQTLEVWVPER